MSPCQICSAPVSKRPPSRPQGRFCSLKCVGEHCRRVASVDRRCESCGETYRRPRAVRTRFCSPQCAGRGLSSDRSEQRTCETCGSTFRRPRWAIEAGRFCSTACYQGSVGGAGNPNFKDGRAAFDPQRYKQHASVVRRGRLRVALGRHFTRAEWSRLKARHDYRCLKCDRREPVIVLEPDHIVPIARGGAKSIDNIQPLCRRCNRAKSAKTINYTAARMG